MARTRDDDAHTPEKGYGKPFSTSISWRDSPSVVAESITSSRPNASEGADIAEPVDKPAPARTIPVAAVFYVPHTSAAIGGLPEPAVTGDCWSRAITDLYGGRRA